MSTTCPPTGDGDGDIDAAPDARQPAFTDHETEYSCAGDPNARALLHFESTPFTDEQAERCINSVSAMDSSVQVAGKFGMGVSLNVEQSDTRFVEIVLDPIAPPYTIEAWIQPDSLPDNGESMIIASRLRPVAGTDTITNAAWMLSLNSTGRLRLDFYGPDCVTPHPFSPYETDATVGLGAPSHVRAVVTNSEIRMFINGFTELEEPITGVGLCQSPIATTRIGAVDRQGLPDPFLAGFPLFKGFVDEFRFSDVAR